MGNEAWPGLERRWSAPYKTGALWELLTREPSRVVTRAAVIERLYGSAPPPQALASVRNLIGNLRCQALDANMRIVAVRGVGWRLDGADTLVGGRA